MATKNATKRNATKAPVKVALGPAKPGVKVKDLPSFLTKLGVSQADAAHIAKMRRDAELAHERIGRKLPGEKLPAVKPAAKPAIVTAKAPRQIKRDRARAAAAIKPAVRTAAATGDYSAAEIRGMWPRHRAERIIAIMQTDGISYARAVKRSRRRMINEGTW